MHMDVMCVYVYMHIRPCVWHFAYSLLVYRATWKFHYKLDEIVCFFHYKQDQNYAGAASTIVVFFTDLGPDFTSLTSGCEL